MFLRFKSIIRADTGTGGKETSILDGRGQQEGRKRRGTEVEAATAAGRKEKEEWKGGEEEEEEKGEYAAFQSRV